MQVYEAIRQVTAAMSAGGIKKGRKNAQQGYAFRGIDDVLNTLSPALSEAGLIVLPRVTERVVTERETKNGGMLFGVTVRVEFDLVSAVDGSTHTVATYGEAMDSADKATNKALSAAYKYMALLAFCIPVEGTPDADEDTPEPKGARKPTATLRAPVNSSPLIAAIQAAGDLPALRRAHVAGVRACGADVAAVDALTAAKDARKAELTATRDDVAGPPPADETRTDAAGTYTGDAP
jgi:hypothetical protein